MVPQNTITTPVERRDLAYLFCKINKVTAYHRHGAKIPQRALDELANFQIDFEEKYPMFGGD